MPRLIATALLAGAISTAAPQATTSAADGKSLFDKNCAMCHNPNADNRTPTADALKRVPYQAILVALETGSMRAQGASLSAVERQAVANFISPRPAAGSADTARENLCPAGAPPLANRFGVYSNAPGHSDPSGGAGEGSTFCLLSEPLLRLDGKHKTGWWQSCRKLL